MDISGLTAELAQEEEGVELPIFQKNGEPYLSLEGKPSTITVVGGDSKRVVASNRRSVQRRLNRSSTKKMTPVELEAFAMEADVAGVISWYGWDDGTEETECTPANVKLVFINAPHIQRQVHDGVEAHSDFIAEPSRS